MNKGIGRFRLTQILGSIILFLAGTLFALLIILASLQPQKSEFSLIWVFMAIFLIIWFEGVIWWLRQSLRIEDSKLEYREKSIWTRFGLFSQYAGIVLSIIIILILLSILSPVISFFISKFDYDSISISREFLSLVSTCGLYIITRNPIISALRKIGSSLVKRFKGSFANYTLSDNGLIIDLKWNNFKGQPGKYLINIGFDEIEEIRTFSFVEAQTFIDSWVDSNTELRSRQVKDMVDFSRGKIARPSVYESISSTGRTVFLKGPNLFYLITFDVENVDDLMNAYNSFKQKR